jgi:hypothetical protein
MPTTITAVQDTKIKHGLLINLTVNATTYYIANTYSPITWNGNTYTALGHFLGIGDIQDDIRATNNSLQVSLSGIPSQGGETEPNYIGLVLNENIKGSRIQIYRVFFDTETLAILPGQVYLRFSGYVSNYTLTDSVDSQAKTATNTVIVQCSNLNAVMEKKIVGRRTNGADQRSRYPNDSGLDRVTVISNKSFDFGKPYTATGTGGGSGGGNNKIIDQTQTIEF